MYTLVPQHATERALVSCQRSPHATSPELLTRGEAARAMFVYVRGHYRVVYLCRTAFIVPPRTIRATVHNSSTCQRDKKVSGRCASWRFPARQTMPGARQQKNAPGPRPRALILPRFRGRVDTDPKGYPQTPGPFRFPALRQNSPQRMPQALLPFQGVFVLWWR